METIAVTADKTNTAILPISMRPSKNSLVQGIHHYGGNDLVCLLRANLQYLLITPETAL
jgi:hypothetical protein